MTARAQAYRVYRAPEPELLDRRLHNRKGGWRRLDRGDLLRTRDACRPLDLTPLAVRCGLTPRERRLECLLAAFGVVALAVAIYLATH